MNNRYQSSNKHRRAMFWNIAVLFALLFSLLATTTPATTSNVATDDFTAIDRYIEQEMHTARVPGLALGIVQGDQIVHLIGQEAILSGFLALGWGSVRTALAYLTIRTRKVSVQ